MKNLTDTQWIFHAAEVRMRRKENIDKDFTLLDFLIAKLENAIYDSGVFSRTDIRFSFVKEQLEKIRRNRDEYYKKKHKPSDSVRQEMLDQFNEVKDISPQYLDIEEVDEEIMGMKRIKVPKKGRRRNGRH